MHRITDEMLLAAAAAIADVVLPEQLNASFIVPSVFDASVSPAVAHAIGGGGRPGPDQRLGRSGPGGGLMTEPVLTHLDRAGAARMVDVTDKVPSARRAVASGRVRTTAEVTALLVTDGLPKGDGLAVARIAGLMGAKRTADLIPLCHPIALSGVTVDLTVEDALVLITATVKTADRTGVEMEALTAVAVAGLALHDMIKAVDPAATLTDVRVDRKEGGKTGLWTRPEERG